MKTFIHHEVVGEGEPLVFLNGVMMTTLSWKQQTDVFSRQYRCVLHDFRGQLKSSKPPGPYSVAMHVDDLAHLLDELQIGSAHLAGTSYGGEVGMLFAGRFPQRVRSLTLLGCVAKPDEPLKRTVARWASMARNAPETLWDETVHYNYSAEFIRAHPLFIEIAKERLASLPREWFIALAEMCDAFNDLDVPLDAIRCPTLVMCGSEDRLKPVRFSREIAAGIPGAELEIIEGAGHALAIERAAAVNERIAAFLRRCRAARTTEHCK